MPVFKGFIKDVKYNANLTPMLKSYDLKGFDINSVKTSGLIQTSTGVLAFSKWLSPKRSRSYPFERVYNTYNSLGQKIIAIIPIIKDEGINGENDFIAYNTFSWMSLFNIYIVLAYYSSANKNPRMLQKIEKQEFELAFICDQIDSIVKYEKNALCWNQVILENQFINVLEIAVNCYENISLQTGVQTHSHLKRLNDYSEDLKVYQEDSLNDSKNAAFKETKAKHAFEAVTTVHKYVVEIDDCHGGVYFLVPDVIQIEDNIWVIIESKNTTKGKKLPTPSDIKDGLFKLIMFSNLDHLDCDGVSVEFKTRLQLTGNGVRGQLKMPCPENEVKQFLQNNTFSKTQQITIKLLNQEAQSNPKLEILIESNGVK